MTQTSQSPLSPSLPEGVSVVYEGVGGPTIIWVTHGDAQTSATNVAAKVRELAGNRAFTLVAFAVTDWNAQLSPWAASANNQEFAGEARETLNWIESTLIPCCDTPLIIAGYSLAGLFSLWALAESRSFAGAISCSGSLWFPGWEEYAAAAQWPTGSQVYLSLGSKEELSRNECMARVGDATRAFAQQLKANSAIHASTLEMNKGGHFSDPEGRMAKGVAWVVGKSSRVKERDRVDKKSTYVQPIGGRVDKNSTCA